MELNWEKTSQMHISTDSRIFRPTGEPIKTARGAIYLGGLITCDGKPTTEVTRRLGEATNIFKQKWARASVGEKQTYIIYSGCVLSKLMCSLESLWLLKADRSRFYSFHCKCVRILFGIPHSFISRVRNSDVLQRASSTSLYEILRERQVALYSRIARSPDPSLIKHILCDSDGIPNNWARRRKRGRPRQQWATFVYDLFCL